MSAGISIGDVIETLTADDYDSVGRGDDVGPRKDAIPVFFTIDDAYAPYAGIAINSLVKNVAPGRDLDIVILHSGLSEKRQRKLRALAADGARLRFVKMADKIAGIEEAHHNKLRQDYFTLTIFFRLFIPAMFPEYDKGIYLDSDIVVPGNIAELYDTDLRGNLIGACCDLSIRGVPELVAYTNNWVGVGIESYINSGVLLMDLRALRAAKLDERFLDLLGTYAFQNIAPDQDYLNVLCHGKILYLDPSWDAMPPVGGGEQVDDPKLIHYNLFQKPWCYDNIPYRDYFWRYAEDSGFLEDVKSRKETYSDLQKASDAECMATLVRHAGNLSEEWEGSFASVFNTGKERRL